jgi:DNA (cytosine-5)-methyltransferase 1
VPDQARVGAIAGRDTGGDEVTFGSLFAGIGGMDLGLERAGMVCRWQVEIDDYATRVLEKHWPDVVRFRDVRGVGSHNLEPVDLICGGFPCQDISNAGKRAGIGGERSGLWSEFARIAGELRPRYVVVENVSALLGRGLDTVLGDLAALGLDAEWHCIPASAVGAPHRRDRVFVLAYDPKHGRGAGGQGRFDPGCSGEPEQPLQDVAYAHPGRRPGWAGEQRASGRREPENGRDVPDAAGAGLEEWHGVLARGARPHATTAASVWWSVEPNVGRVAHGIPSRMDRLRCLGNAVVPQVAEFIGRQLMEAMK